MSMNYTNCSNTNIEKMDTTTSVNSGYRSGSCISSNCYPYEFTEETEPSFGESYARSSEYSQSSAKDSYRDDAQTASSRGERPEKQTRMDEQSMSCDLEQSPTATVQTEAIESESMHSEQTAVSVVESNGYVYHRKIAKTLQGEIFEAVDGNKHLVVIKKAEKKLIAEGVTIRDGKRIKIREDIWREIKIQQYLDSFERYQGSNKASKLPAEHIRLLKVLQDEEHVYVVTEHGGSDFFKWTCHAHKLIERGQISLKYWWKNMKFLFKQMVDYTLWLHHEMKICHLDISLENMLLQNAEYFYETGKFSYSQQIKFCDFGLAEYFDTSHNPNFQCNKHVGKESYMAPEVYTKSEGFDARKADAWSLGVVLFIMMSGAPAYSRPDVVSDTSFQYIVYGKIPNLLQSWGRLHYVNPLMLDLLQHILVYDPRKRYSVQQIRNHPFLQ